MWLICWANMGSIVATGMASYVKGVSLLFCYLSVTIIWIENVTVNAQGVALINTMYFLWRLTTCNSETILIEQPGNILLQYIIYGHYYNVVLSRYGIPNLRVKDLTGSAKQLQTKWGPKPEVILFTTTQHEINIMY